MWFRRKVQPGKKLGRQIGFPTINLNVGSFGDHVSPGIYACEVKWNKKIHKGALHFGPVLDSKKNKLEIHILDFNQNIYNCFVQFRIIKKIREPRRFTDLEELKKQIIQDVKLSR